MSTADFRPASRTSAATSSAACCERRPWTITSAPASASARATARPMPEVEPRTIVRIPCKLIDWSISRHRCKTAQRAGPKS